MTGFRIGADKEVLANSLSITSYSDKTAALTFTAVGEAAECIMAAVFIWQQEALCSPLACHLLLKA